jgi:carbon-monoxide dehydrogenase medium subunit
MAGGTAVVVLLSQGLLRPRYVVDLSALSELQGVGALDGGGVRIGALTSIRVLERHPAIRGGHASLAEAASQVASVRVRNVATLGGSVCYGEPQTDLPPALIALGAMASVTGPGGARSLALDRFYRGPYQTALAAGELLTEVVLPPRPSSSGGCHLKFTIGPPENKPVANASVALVVDPATQRCANVRIVLGAVGPVPVLATGAGALLQGERPDGRLIGEAATRASEEADPTEDLRGSVWYKRRIVKVLVERALICAVERASSRQR